MFDRDRRGVQADSGWLPRAIEGVEVDWRIQHVLEFPRSRGSPRV